MDMNKKTVSFQYKQSNMRRLRRSWRIFWCGSDHCASDMGIDRLLRNRLDCLYYCSGHYAAELG